MGLLSPQKIHCNFLHHLRGVHEKFWGWWLEGNGRMLILASLARKHLIRTFLTSFTSCSWKILIPLIVTILLPFGWFWPPCAQNICFQLCNDHVRRVHEKFWDRWLEKVNGRKLIWAFWSPKRLIPTFLHHLRGVHEKFWCRWLEEGKGRKLISASLAQKHLIRTFLTSFTSCSWKIFIKLIGTILLPFSSFWRPCAQNIWLGLLSPKTLDSNFFDVIYVVILKKFWSH